VTPGGNNCKYYLENQSNSIILDYTFCLLDCTQLVGLYGQTLIMQSQQQNQQQTVAQTKGNGNKFQTFVTKWLTHI